jgi:hypothetical protein
MFASAPVILHAVTLTAHPHRLLGVEIWYPNLGEEKLGKLTRFGAGGG